LNFKIVNIIDLYEEIGEDQATQFLSSFYCPRNTDIEKFLTSTNLGSSKKKRTVISWRCRSSVNSVRIFRINTVEKCTLCFNLIDKEKEPKCVACCTAKARYVGDLDDPVKWLKTLDTEAVRLKEDCPSFGDAVCPRAL
jgi:Fe-S-cluster-containing dehydrogenase component